MAIPKPVLSSDPTLRCVTCDSAEVAAHVPGLQVHDEGLPYVLTARW